MNDNESPDAPLSPLKRPLSSSVMIPATPKQGNDLRHLNSKLHALISDNIRQQDEEEIAVVPASIEIDEHESIMLTNSIIESGIKVAAGEEEQELIRKSSKIKQLI